MLRIAIDGPGGAGKSSLAKAVAAKLGIIYVDTGALYRTIGLYMLDNGVPTSDEDAVSRRLPELRLELSFAGGVQRIILNGVDVGDRIRTPEVSMAASAVSALPSVRAFLLEKQKEIAATHNVIMDGRDIGTVIIPDAEVKIFLTAKSETRAKRRYNELIAKGQDVTYEQVLAEMIERDKNDSTRAIAPCVPAPDAILFDNSKYAEDITLKKILKIIKKRRTKLEKKGFYMFLHSLLAPFLRFLFKVEVVGAEKLPQVGGYLLCSNHIAKRDVVLIGACSERPINFIAKKELFGIPVLSSLISALGAIRIDRGGNDISAIRKSIELIKSGQVVAIFPQGHRYPKINPASTPLRNGAGLISYRAKCPVIPVCIKTDKIKYALFRKVEIIFGDPIPYEELGFTEEGSQDYMHATELIFGKVCELGGYKGVEEKC